MIKLNRAQLENKIHACWLGKSLGGTLGATYEGKPSMNDIQGFCTKPGEVIPNDDLDLQLVWLKAMTERGPEGVDENVLAEYWLNYIPPFWNEYGVGKSNLREGFFPPLSGEFNNEQWKHSNGAWIRTEIWACLYPGRPEKSIYYAYADACVDHGFGEGTYAAIFTAAMESAAFVFSDLNTMLDIGLSKIPENCRLARCVRLVRKAHQEGTDWMTVRQRLVEETSDMGWFQAPCNLAFVVLSLLYGAGDFKKSVILAVNCGDDTDCTAATTGAILGIMGGMTALPPDWTAHLGDQIVSGSLIYGHGRFPKSNQELTECIMSLLPITLHRHFFYSKFDDGIDVCITEEPNDFSQIRAENYCGGQFVEERFRCKRYSFSARSVFFEALVELDDKPKLLPLQTLSGKVTVRMGNNPGQTHFHLRWFTPEGWSVSGYRHIYVPIDWHDGSGSGSAEFVITAGENPEGHVRLVLEISTDDKPGCCYVPICIVG